MDVKAKQVFDPTLVELKEAVLKKSKEEMVRYVIKVICVFPM